MTTKTTALLACAAGLVLAGCGGSQPASARRLAFITNNAADFWTIARKGVEKADTELGDASVEFRLGDGTAAEQKRIVDDLLAKGVDGITISPVDPANQTAMLNDAAQKAVVFTHDSDAPGTKRECYVGTDNVAAGREAGALIKGALPQGGKIAVFVGKLDARNAQERLQGIKDAIAGTRIEILDVRTDDTDQVRAKANVAEMLVSHPDVAALVGLWSYNGPAILMVRRARSSADFEKRRPAETPPKIVQFDGSAKTSPNACNMILPTRVEAQSALSPSLRRSDSLATGFAAGTAEDDQTGVMNCKSSVSASSARRNSSSRLFTARASSAGERATTSPLMRSRTGYTFSADGSFFSSIRSTRCRFSADGLSSFQRDLRRSATRPSRNGARENTRAAGRAETALRGVPLSAGWNHATRTSRAGV